MLIAMCWQCAFGPQLDGGCCTPVIFKHRVSRDRYSLTMATQSEACACVYHPASQTQHMYSTHVCKVNHCRMSAQLTAGYGQRVNACCGVGIVCGMPKEVQTLAPHIQMGKQTNSGGRNVSPQTCVGPRSAREKQEQAGGTTPM